jgi:hypothetical protein
MPDLKSEVASALADIDTRLRRERDPALLGRSLVGAFDGLALGAWPVEPGEPVSISGASPSRM